MTIHSFEVKKEAKREKSLFLKNVGRGYIIKMWRNPESSFL